MKLKTTLAVLALALTPALAFAQCRDEAKTQSTSACGEGQVWDTEAQACVPKPMT